MAKWARRRKMQDRTSVLFIRNLDSEVKDMFKSWCARRGLCMTWVIEKLMKELATGKVGKSLETEILLRCRYRVNTDADVTPESPYDFA